MDGKKALRCRLTEVRYVFRHDGLLVEDPGLTDTGYANLADHVRRHVDRNRWTVAPEAAGLKIKERK